MARKLTTTTLPIITLYSQRLHTPNTNLPLVSKMSPPVVAFGSFPSTFFSVFLSLSLPHTHSHAHTQHSFRVDHVTVTGSFVTLSSPSVAEDMPLLAFYFLLNFAQFLQPSSSLDFRFNSFNTTDLFLVGDTRVESNGVVRLTNATSQFSIGRAFFPSPLLMITATNSSGNNTMNGRASVTSFSTTFIFSILPIIPSSPGFGLAFVLSASTAPPGALPGQYFGLFNNTAERLVGPLLAIEFDTGRNPEFGETDGNHVGVI